MNHRHHHHQQQQQDLIIKYTMVSLGKGLLQTDPFVHKSIVRRRSGKYLFMYGKKLKRKKTLKHNCHQKRYQISIMRVEIRFHKSTCH